MLCKSRIPEVKDGLSTNHSEKHMSVAKALIPSCFQP